MICFFPLCNTKDRLSALVQVDQRAQVKCNVKLRHVTHGVLKEEGKKKKESVLHISAKGGRAGEKVVRCKKDLSSRIFLAKERNDLCFEM